MSRDPYRRPERAAPEKPRGLVVRRADQPEDLEAADRRRREARHRAQSIVAQAEYEEAQRATNRRTRAGGVLAIVVSLGLCAATIASLGEGYYHPRTVLLAPAGLFAGTFALAFGAGRAPTLQSAPRWVKIGATVSFGIGMLWGATDFVDLLALFAR